MLGAGVFVVWGPALRAAGPLIVVAVAIAGAVAVVNALSSAQLAATYPEAGGAYTYGRAEIGPTAGFVAGVAFVAGKTASVAAVALAIGSYVWDAHPAAVATAAIAASWALNARGVARTAAVATAIGAAVLLGLGGVMLAVLRAGPASHPIAPLVLVTQESRLGVLSAAGLIFFAFAGYARVATLGEEVREPSRTIPRAIAFAVVAVGALYLVIGFAFTSTWYGSLFDVPGVPLRDLAGHVYGGATVVAVLAPVSALGALVALTAGIGRTAMAMARNSDLPRVFSRRDRAGVPWIAEGASAVASTIVVWRGNLTFALAMSASAVLVYYAIANVAAFRQARGRRTVSWHIPQAVSAVGALSCLVLAATLPFAAVSAAGACLAVALIVRAVAGRREA
jgi:APA family basic amino acid/polyamine antiporter